MLFHASVIPHALLEENDSRGAVGAADQARIGAGECGDLLWGLMAAFLEQLLRVGTIYQTFKGLFPSKLPCFPLPDLRERRQYGWTCWCRY